MIDAYEIRQQVHTIHKSWLEVIASGSIERVVRDEYNRYVRDYPDEYFEFCKIERHEHCLAFTPKEQAP